MPLLPLDLILTVGSATAAFVLGIVVWSRNRWAAGSILFVFIAFSLSLWTSSDWFVILESTALPFQVLLWKLLFNASVCFGPALAVHLASIIARRRVWRDIRLVYLLSIISFSILISGIVAPVFGITNAPFQPLLSAGAAMALFVYIGALFFVAIQLYPIIFSTVVSVIDRRRAVYGTLILVLFLTAGAFQLVIGPIPTGLVVSAITSLFLILSLAAFVRVSFLGVTFSSLESFLFLLVVFGIILLLRSQGWVEATVILVGIIIVGAFGFMAVMTVDSEHRRRLLVEQTNRKLTVLEAAKSDFVDMVAHQLRTPLGGIRAASSMLVDGDYGTLPDKARAAVTLIEDTANQLLSRAESFLSMSRLDVGIYRGKRVSTDVRAEISQAIDEMRSSATAKRITLEANIEPGIPQNILIDKEALRNALFNLIDNAIKYTDAGSVHVHIRSTKHTVEFEVSDTGFGMDTEELHDLFKKFHRGSVGRSHAMDGTGLGLYIVRKLVEAAGGHISASSNGPGTGASFAVVLPIGSV